MKISFLLRNIVQEHTILFVDSKDMPMILIHSQCSENQYGLSRHYKIKSTNKDFFAHEQEQHPDMESALIIIYQDFKNNQAKYLNLKEINKNNTQILSMLKKVYDRNNEIEEGSLLLLNKLIELGYKPRKKKNKDEIEIRLKNQPTDQRIEFPHDYYDNDMSSYTSNNQGYVSFRLSSKYYEKEYLKASKVDTILQQIERCEQYVIKKLT